MALCDTLLWLAKEKVYSPRWSAHILDEVRRTLLARNMCSGEQADWRINTMRKQFEDAEVFSYERFIDSQSQTGDENDRHVIAAAIIGGASQIITNNSKHFPSVIEPNGIEVISPDEFLMNALDFYPESTFKALHNQADSLRRPPMGISQVLASLARCGAHGFATEVQAAINQL